MGDLGDIANMVQDMGLAQTISDGLQKAQQVAPCWPNAEQLEEKKAATKSLSPIKCYDTKIGRLCMTKWAEVTGTSLSSDIKMRRASTQEVRKASMTPPTEQSLSNHWENFSQSPQYDWLCKYLYVIEKTMATSIKPSAFAEQRALGRGAFGAVYLVFKKDSGLPFATKKQMKKNVKKANMFKDVLVEHEVLKKCYSRFLVNLHYAWQDNVNLGLVLTLCPGGDLAFMIEGRYQKDSKGKKSGTYNKLEMDNLKYYMASMALGLADIHKAGYVYRDLKPQNVLLTIEGFVKISDMGLAHSIAKGPISQRSGTRGYWSPETINKAKYTCEPDWWSLGCTAFRLFSDKAAFHGKSDEETDAATCAGEINYKHDEPKDLQGIINALCCMDQTKRLGCCGNGVEEIKSHAFFKDFDWYGLREGNMKPPFAPDPNDINAPDAKDIEAFVEPKGVTWDPEDVEKFANWDMVNEALLDEELALRMTKKQDLDGGVGGGGGGCCVIS